MINSNLYNFFNYRRIKSPIIVRIQDALQLYDIPIQPVLTFKTQTIYYHNLLLPRMDFEMVCVNKNDTPHHILRSIFRSLIREKYDKHKILSTQEEGVGSAAIMGTKRETVSLPRVSTIFTAKVIALRLAVKLVRGGSLEDNYQYAQTLSVRYRN